MARSIHLGGFSLIYGLINRGIANVQADIDAHKANNPASWARRAKALVDGTTKWTAPRFPVDTYVPPPAAKPGFWDGVKRTARRIFNRGG